MGRLIDADVAIDVIKKRLFETAFNNVGIKQNIDETIVDVAENRLENWFNELPPIQPELKELSEWKADFKGYINDLNMPKDDYDGIMEYIDEVPSAQPDIIRCKDCAYCDSDDVDAPYGMTKKIFWCDRLYAGANENLIVEPDDFCSWAERREDKHETD